ncbi:MAG: homocysteine S-methyltransferase family protein [Candidatus Omnitrophica bacterium]|nr:homocysteine S-methyltransferase family protein [Candidatus Omnitrophota bacterium]
MKPKKKKGTAPFFKKGIMVADGAMGTMLQKAGIQQGECNEEWNLSHAETITDIHQQYIEAGAEMIITNTFGGNPIKLKTHGLSERMAEINFAALSLAKKAVERSHSSKKILIAGDIGPTGEFMVPLGISSVEDFYDNFNAQVEVLVKGGVDLIIIETMTAIEEVEVCLRAAKESGLPVIVSMSFNRDKDGNNFHTMMGAGLEQFVEISTKGNADAIGVNCGVISLEMDEIIQRLRKLTTIPLMAEPNAGLPKLIDGKTIYDLASEKMGELAVRLKNAGANIIGGCCGTTPAHIKAIAQAIR